MTLALHDEIRQVAHAIITEYVRAYPAMPHTDVLLRFSNRLESAVLKLIRAQGVAPNSPDDGPNTNDPNVRPPVPQTQSSDVAQTAISTGGLAAPVAE